MIIKGQLTEDDIVSAYYLNLPYKKNFLILFPVSAILCFCAAFLSDRSSQYFIILGVMNSIFISMYWLNPFIIKRNFRKNKSLSEQTNIAFRENGIFFKTQYGENLVPWAHIIKWKKNEKLILIYPQKRLHFIIPSHYFETHQAFLEFAEKLETQIGKPK